MAANGAHAGNPSRAGGKLAVGRKAKKTKPEGTFSCSRLEVWEKTASKTHDLNHP